jgi:hypothetical protein
MTDKLRSYSAAKYEIGLSARNERPCARTIGLGIRISRHDGASAKYRVSDRSDQPDVYCPFTPPFKTPSTSSAIFHPAARSATSEKKISGRGEPPPRSEPEPGTFGGRALCRRWVRYIVTDAALVFGVEAKSTAAS